MKVAASYEDTGSIEKKIPGRFDLGTSVGRIRHRTWYKLIEWKELPRVTELKTPGQCLYFLNPRARTKQSRFFGTSGERRSRGLFLAERPPGLLACWQEYSLRQLAPGF